MWRCARMRAVDRRPSGTPMAQITRITRGAQARRWLPSAGLAVALLAPHGARAEGPQTDLDPIAVRIYDFASVDSAGLAVALRDARVIFADAGIDTEWHDCTRGAKSSSPFCVEPRRPSDLIVRIVRRPESREGLPAALGT